jgi:hypothetical protein
VLYAARAIANAQNPNVLWPKLLLGLKKKSDDPDHSETYLDRTLGNTQA